MWSVVAALRSNQLDRAFDEFEPLLIFLQREWSDDYWSIVLLEAWLLFEVGLQKEAHTLLKEVPNDSMDLSGKHILLFTELYRQKVNRRTKQVLEPCCRRWFTNIMELVASSKYRTICREKRCSFTKYDEQSIY